MADDTMKNDKKVSYLPPLGCNWKRSENLLLPHSALKALSLCDIFVCWKIELMKIGFILINNWKYAFLPLRAIALEKLPIHNRSFRWPRYHGTTAVPDGKTYWYKSIFIVNNY